MCRLTVTWWPYSRRTAVTRPRPSTSSTRSVSPLTSQSVNSLLFQERKLTGASFVVFNGALKSSANLTAKSSIVEDGLMVQVMPDHMTNILKTFRNMEDLTIGCGPVGAEQPDEVWPNYVLRNIKLCGAGCEDHLG